MRSETCQNNQFRGTAPFIGGSDARIIMGNDEAP